MLLIYWMLFIKFDSNAVFNYVAAKGSIDMVNILLSDNRFTDQINAKDNVSDNIILHVTN